MAYTFVSGGEVQLTKKLNPGDATFTADVDLGITRGRVYFKNDDQEEWISFSGVAASGSYYAYTIVLRSLSQTADPATGTTGLTWLAGNIGVNVSMHDQQFDKQYPVPLIFATTAARDTALGANGVPTVPFFGVYVTATGLFYNYNLSTAQWETVETGTTTPNASTTAAGKVEIATTAESISAASDTGGTGAYLSATLSDIAKNTQSNTFTYGADAGGDDTYVVALTPVLAAYTTGQVLQFKPTTSNTGACTLDFGPGVKNIKTKDGNDPQTGVIRASEVVTVVYDGTNFVLQDEDFATTANKGIVEMCTDAEAETGTDETRYINAKQNKPLLYLTQTTASINAASVTTTITHSLGRTPLIINLQCGFTPSDAANGHKHYSNGYYISGSQMCMVLYGATTGTPYAVDTASNQSTYAGYLSDSATSVNYTMTIQNVTSTSFDIVTARSNTVTNTVHFTVFVQA